jgi:hypothetical protein
MNMLCTFSTLKGRMIFMLLSRKLLLRILGALWLLDGLLQLQPKMFTMNMVNSVLVPTLQGQPALIASNLQWIIDITTQHLIVVNLLIAVVQILMGLGLMALSEQWAKIILLASIVWAIAVWYGGEGMSMLLTGQGSVLTGAPGAVLLYPLLGLVAYPRTVSKDAAERREGGALSRLQLRYIFAGFWFFAAFLQFQPFWWQPGQISQVMAAMTGQGGLNGILVDSVLQPLAVITAHLEVPLNITLILVFLGLGTALAVSKEERLRPILIASIIVSLVIWYGAEAFGMIFTGMATDFNTGLLLVVIALACWPKMSLLRAAQNKFAHERQTLLYSGQPEVKLRS